MCVQKISKSDQPFASFRAGKQDPGSMYLLYRLSFVSPGHQHYILIVAVGRCRKRDSNGTWKEMRHSDDCVSCSTISLVEMRLLPTLVLCPKGGTTAERRLIKTARPLTRQPDIARISTGAASAIGRSAGNWPPFATVAHRCARNDGSPGAQFAYPLAADGTGSRKRNIREIETKLASDSASQA